jgi:hypothetical protein
VDENVRRNRESYRALLIALEVVFADPARLAEAVGGAEDDADAAARIAAAFGIGPGAAAAVLDQPVRGLTRTSSAQRARDILALGNEPPRG